MNCQNIAGFCMVFGRCCLTIRLIKNCRWNFSNSPTPVLFRRNVHGALLELQVSADNSHIITGSRCSCMFWRMFTKDLVPEHFENCCRSPVFWWYYMVLSCLFLCKHAYSVFGSRGTDIRFKICIRFLAFRSAVESYTPQKVFVVVVFVVFKY